MNRRTRVQELADLAFTKEPIATKSRKSARRELRHLLTTQIKERVLSGSVRMRSTESQMWAYSKKLAIAAISRERRSAP